MIGESQAAREVARQGRPQYHDIPPSTPIAFIERALDLIRNERASGRLVGGNPVAFVRKDFTQKQAAYLGPEIEFSVTPPSAGSLYLCGDGFLKCCDQESGLATVGAHLAKIAANQWDHQSWVIFDPASGEARVRCPGLGPQSPVVMSMAGAAPADWKLDDIDSAVDTFDQLRVEQTPLYELLFDNGQLRGHARAHYRDALYLYLRFELGLDRSAGFMVTTRSSTVTVQKRSVGLAAVEPCGVRHGYDATSEVAKIVRLVSRLSAVIKPNHRTLVNCLACPDATFEPAGTGAQLGFRHNHLMAG